MEIARLTAICRKSNCRPLENKLVRLRSQISTLEEGRDNHESQYALMEEHRDNHESQYALMEKQLAR